MEHLEASTERPLAQVLQGGVQDDRLARLVRQEGFGVRGYHFDAFTGTTELEEEKGEKGEDWEDLGTQLPEHL